MSDDPTDLTDAPTPGWMTPALDTWIRADLVRRALSVLDESHDRYMVFRAFRWIIAARSLNNAIRRMDTLFQTEPLASEPWNLRLAESLCLFVEGGSAEAPATSAGVSEAIRIASVSIFPPAIFPPVPEHLTSTTLTFSDRRFSPTEGESSGAEPERGSAI